MIAPVLADVYIGGGLFGLLVLVLVIYLIVVIVRKM